MHGYCACVSPYSSMNHFRNGSQVVSANKRRAASKVLLGQLAQAYEQLQALRRPVVVAQDVAPRGAERGAAWPQSVSRTCSREPLVSCPAYSVSSSCFPSALGAPGRETPGRRWGLSRLLLPQRAA